MNENRILSRRDEMETLLPFYVSGTLDGDDLREVEDWLADDPAARAALAEAEAEAEATIRLNEAIELPAGALARFSAALDAEAPGATAKGASLLSRLAGWLGGAPSNLGWAAAALMLAVVVAQGVMQRGDEARLTIAGAENPAATAPFILVMFQPEATIADIQAALKAANATVIDGPNGEGVFKIGVPAANAADYDAALKALAEASVTRTAIAGRRPFDAN